MPPEAIQGPMTKGKEAEAMEAGLEFLELDIGHWTLVIP